MIKTSTIILVLIIVFSLQTKIFAQSCSEIRQKAARLEAAQNKEDPNTYYLYGKFLADQKVADKGCIDRKVLDEFRTVYWSAAELGNLKAATRLGMISAYGLYSYPRDPASAYGIVRHFLTNTINIVATPEYKECGWVNFMLLLRFAEPQDGGNMSSEYVSGLNAVFKLLIETEPFPISDEDLNSMKKAKRDYYRIISRIYNNGEYNVTRNAELAIKYAFRVSDVYGYKVYKQYVDDNPNDKLYRNKAAELFMAAFIKKETYSYRNYIVNIYDEYTKSIKSIAEFKTVYSQMPEKLKDIMKTSFDDYTSLESKWELIKNSNLKEPEAYPGWKFLPSSEKKSMFYEAKKGRKGSYDSKKRFQIFKAMVEHGNDEALLFLGMYYMNGYGVAKRGHKAEEQFKKAFNYADTKAEAAYNLARMYDLGTAIEQDWVKAVFYYNLATSFNAASYRYLAEMHLFGVGGCTKSISKSMSLMEKAANKGDEKAKKELVVIEDIYFTLNSGSSSSYIMSSYHHNGVYAYKESAYEIFIKDEKTVEPRIIKKGGIDYTLGFHIEQTSAKNNIKIFPVNPNKPEQSLKFGSYSPSPTFTEDGEFTVINYSYGDNSYRDIGYFYVSVNKNDGYGVIRLILPTAVCFMD